MKEKDFNSKSCVDVLNVLRTILAFPLTDVRLAIAITLAPSLFNAMSKILKVNAL